MKNFLTDFGFRPGNRAVEGYKQIEFGPKDNRTIAFWTFLVYVSLSFGILLRRTVHFPDPLPGVNTAVFAWGIIAASFIIGLAILSPLLRVISKFQKGKLSWQHCLTAFTIGFFGDLTFDFLVKSFVGILKR